MCTVRCSGRWGRGVYPSMHWSGEVYSNMHWARGLFALWGVCPVMSVQGGVCLGECLPGGVCQTPPLPLWTEWLTDTCENITLLHKIWGMFLKDWYWYEFEVWGRMTKHSLCLSWKECKNEILLIHTNVPVLLELIFQHSTYFLTMNEIHPWQRHW